MNLFVGIAVLLATQPVAGPPANGEWALRARLDAGDRMRVSFSSDGKLLLGNGPSAFRVWRPSKEKDPGLVFAPQPLYARGGGLRPEGLESPAAFSPDGRLLAARRRTRGMPPSSDFVLLETEKFTKIAGLDETGRFGLIAFSRDGKLLVMAETFKNGEFGLFDIEAKRLRRVAIQHEGHFTELVISPRDEWCAVAVTCKDCNKIILVSTQTGEVIRRIEQKSWAAPGGLAISPDSRWIAQAGGNDKLVRVWNAATGEERTHFTGHVTENVHDGRSVSSVAFSPDGTLIATACNEPWSVRLWDWKSDDEVANLQVDGILYGLAFSPDGSLLAAGIEANGPVDSKMGNPKPEILIWKRLPSATEK